MSKFIKLTELDGTEFVINVTCIQMLWKGANGNAHILISFCTGAEQHTVKNSYEEIKTKLCADEETIC
ncbi:hypothetical protein [Snodgrassella alvi]|uniref:hypothetical protein n=1 Tax=Snodgrassella alvi TaxID=1196083 RepID=UPI000C1EF92F|nr:hypothetical protein [Snodgrassella alvi]PIT48570.1 hypothetical protein BHC51_04825 [Snodgrassella alvi]